MFHSSKIVGPKKMAKRSSSIVQVHHRTMPGKRGDHYQSQDNGAMAIQSMALKESAKQTVKSRDAGTNPATGGPPTWGPPTLKESLQQAGLPIKSEPDEPYKQGEFVTEITKENNSPNFELENDTSVKAPFRFSNAGCETLKLHKIATGQQPTRKQSGNEGLLDQDSPIKAEDSMTTPFNPHYTHHEEKSFLAEDSYVPSQTNQTFQAPHTRIPIPDSKFKPNLSGTPYTLEGLGSPQEEINISSRRAMASGSIKRQSRQRSKRSSRLKTAPKQKTATTEQTPKPEVSYISMGESQLQSDQENVFISKLIYSMENRKAREKQRRMKQGGVCRDKTHKSLSCDVKQYNGAMEDLKTLLERVELQQYNKLALEQPPLFEAPNQARELIQHEVRIPSQLRHIDEEPEKKTGRTLEQKSPSQVSQAKKKLMISGGGQSITNSVSSSIVHGQSNPHFIITKSKKGIDFDQLKDFKRHNNRDILAQIPNLQAISQMKPKRTVKRNSTKDIKKSDTKKEVFSSGISEPSSAKLNTIFHSTMDPDSPTKIMGKTPLSGAIYKDDSAPSTVLQSIVQGREQQHTNLRQLSGYTKLLVPPESTPPKSSNQPKRLTIEPPEGIQAAAHQIQITEPSRIASPQGTPNENEEKQFEKLISTEEDHVVDPAVSKTLPDISAPAALAELQKKTEGVIQANKTVGHAAQPKKERNQLAKAGNVKQVTTSVRLSSSHDPFASTFTAFRGTSKSLEGRSLGKQQQQQINLSKIKLELSLNNQLLSLLQQKMNPIKRKKATGKANGSLMQSVKKSEDVQAGEEKKTTKASNLAAMLATQRSQWTKRSNSIASSFIQVQKSPKRTLDPEVSEISRNAQGLQSEDTAHLTNGKQRKQLENLEKLKYQINFQHPSQLNLMIFNTVSEDKAPHDSTTQDGRPMVEDYFQQQSQPLVQFFNPEQQQVLPTESDEGALNRSTVRRMAEQTFGSRFNSQESQAMSEGDPQGTGSVGEANETFIPKQVFRATLQSRGIRFLQKNQDFVRAKRRTMNQSPDQSFQLSTRGLGPRGEPHQISKVDSSNQTEVYFDEIPLSQCVQMLKQSKNHMEGKETLLSSLVMSQAQKGDNSKVVLSRTGNHLRMEGSNELIYNDNNSSSYNYIPLQNQYKSVKQEVVDSDGASQQPAVIGGEKEIITEISLYDNGRTKTEALKIKNEDRSTSKVEEQLSRNRGSHLGTTKNISNDDNRNRNESPVLNEGTSMRFQTVDHIGINPLKARKFSIQNLEEEFVKSPTKVFSNQDLSLEIDTAQKMEPVRQSDPPLAASSLPRHQEKKPRRKVGPAFIPFDSRGFSSQPAGDFTIQAELGTNKKIQFKDIQTFKNYAQGKSMEGLSKFKKQIISLIQKKQSATSVGGQRRNISRLPTRGAGPTPQNYKSGDFMKREQVPHVQGMKYHRMSVCLNQQSKLTISGIRRSLQEIESFQPKIVSKGSTINAYSYTRNSIGLKQHQDSTTGDLTVEQTRDHRMAPIRDPTPEKTFDHFDLQNVDRRQENSPGIHSQNKSPLRQDELTLGQTLNQNNTDHDNSLTTLVVLNANSNHQLNRQFIEHDSKQVSPNSRKIHVGGIPNFNASQPLLKPDTKKKAKIASQPGGQSQQQFSRVTYLQSMISNKISSAGIAKSSKYTRKDTGSQKFNLSSPLHTQNNQEGQQTNSFLGNHTRPSIKSGSSAQQPSSHLRNPYMKQYHLRMPMARKPQGNMSEISAFNEQAVQARQTEVALPQSSLKGESFNPKIVVRHQRAENKASADQSKKTSTQPPSSFNNYKWLLMEESRQRKSSIERTEHGNDHHTLNAPSKG